MIEWIKKSKIVYAAIALLVGTIFNLGAIWAMTPKARDFAVEREAQASMSDRLTRVEEHDRQDDIERADMRNRFDNLEKLIVGIAIQVGAPTKVGK